MNSLHGVVALLTVFALGAESTEVADRLLRTPVTQMDYGILRMTELVVPVLEDAGAQGTVAWVAGDTKVEVQVTVSAAPNESAPWEAARRVAAAARQALGVDPTWGRLSAEGEGELTALFGLVAAGTPSNKELAELIRIRIAVRRGSLLPPLMYVGDLLDDDVHMSGVATH